ncbi:ADAM 8 precursor [Boeremia exigua]|uniref:ADAM 8 precursor n=1 Tax=Boeremia exigua TaxID=749465 RepID=UPI001E8D6631|nr:ADAM 8 precursor [Boeremia exigua]KAH6618471.1 ADAM 8 precursor [Boeremia exigua]
MHILSALSSVLALATAAAASSSHRAPLRTIQYATDADILTPNHRVTAVSSFDLAFTVGSQRFRLSLEPNHDLFVDGGRVTHLAADGSVHAQVPIDRHQHRVFKGTASLLRGSRWHEVGWARIGMRQDGLQPLFEGSFVLNHDHHHIKLASSYAATRVAGDPEAETSDAETMVVFRDSDMGMAPHADHDELRKRAGVHGQACGSDQLGFNTQEDHPVFAGMRARDMSRASMPIERLFGRQLDNQPGSGGAGVNLVSTIGSTQGCPTTRKVALVGVAADCTYIQSFNRDRNQTQQNIIEQINLASELFESTFQISLGLANVVITDPDCPATAQQSTPWNQACSDSVNIQARLNLFSSWRGQQQDTYSHWTLLSTCNTDTAVGLAWLGQACVQGSQQNGGSSSETVAGANVVIRTATEWQVIAHETGHTYGAVHDCTSQSCADSNTVNSQQCCPLSSSQCNAGAQFIMNPSTAQGITRFSPCSIGNICSALQRNSVESSCLTNNRGITTIGEPVCGNGIVEEGEDCDCGGTSQCGDNSCCNPNTCRFINNAVCDDSNEDCCRNCQYANSTVVCRASQGPCDPQETCNGTSPYCPADTWEAAGTSCGENLQCASGQCTSRDQQCKTLMGSYTQGNETYACDTRSCTLSCQSPRFGDTCYGLQQNFLDGTVCAGGHCTNGRCDGNVGTEIKSWIDEHLSLVIGLAAGLGGALVLCILCCCWRSYRRRRSRAKYAAAAAAAGAGRGRRGPPPPMGGYPQGGYGQVGQQGSYPQGAFPQGQGQQWQGNPVPMPPPLQARNSMRYA